ncbi:MAG: indole-3-glycerol phosphate synthase TrpC, partial [Acidobacteriota bacterium]
MKGTILEKIIEAKRLRVESANLNARTPSVIDQAQAVRSSAKDNRLRAALSDGSRINIIAEFKRASPSKGVINDTLDPVETAVKYENGGACAISVLTEEDFFKGSLDDLRTIRKAVDIPILRKDFIIDAYQIYEAAAAGADAILLIVAALPHDDLKRYHSLAEAELGIDALVEVHTVGELKVAIDIGASLIGVNNRNLKTFEVSLDVSRELIEQRPKNSLMITESGIVSRDDITELHSLGFD